MSFERIHYLLARNMQRVRYGKGWTQEDAARAFREYGLSAWRGSSVGQFESRSGRFPALDELLLMCAALGVSLMDLIPEGEETVKLGGITFTTSAIRTLVAGLPGATPPVMVDRQDRVRDIPSDSERYVARKLGIGTADIRSLARELWGRSFGAERDARIGNLERLSRRSIQARRGLTARALITEMREYTWTCPSPRTGANSSTPPPVP